MTNPTKIPKQARATFTARGPRSRIVGGLVLGFFTSLLATLAPAGTGQVQPFCLGDGTGAACPCGNYGSSGAGCVNSGGAGAFLTHSGTPNIFADTFELQVSKCPSNTPGIFFGGSSGSGSLPFGNGLRCVTNDIVRIKAVFCDPSGSAHSDMGISAREGLGPGDVRFYQFWFRDIIGPCGAAYNTSNGCRVQW